MDRAAQGSGSGVEFDIVFTPRMEKQVRKIRNPVILRELDGAFAVIARNPWVGEELSGDLKGLFKIKAVRKTYRVVYEIHESKREILVVQVAHRKDAYDELTRFYRGSRGN